MIKTFQIVVIFSLITTIDTHSQNVSVGNAFYRVLSETEGTDVPNPMLADGREWVYKNHHFEEGSVIPQIIEGNNTLTQYDYSEVVSYTYYTLRGDTLIDGKRYYKTFRRNGDGDENYDRAMREEGRIVYQVMRGDESEGIIFDYRPEVMWRNLVVPDVIETVDTIHVRGRFFVRHHYLDSYSYTVSVIVEGIGMDGNGLMMGSHIQYLPTCVCDYTEFVACNEDGECIFTQHDFYVEAIDTKVESAATSSSAPSSLYDLQGHRLAAPPAKGVYIQDGRKVLK